jgi:hypothetical protein
VLAALPSAIKIPANQTPLSGSAKSLTSMPYACVTTHIIPGSKMLPRTELFKVPEHTVLYLYVWENKKIVSLQNTKPLHLTMTTGNSDSSPTELRINHNPPRYNVCPRCKRVWFLWFPISFAGFRLLKNITKKTALSEVEKARIQSCPFQDMWSVFAIFYFKICAWFTTDSIRNPSGYR